MLHGQLIWWYQDGQKKEEVNFLQGERDGFAWWWYPDGGKNGVADISNGLGKITLFFAAGSIYVATNLSNLVPNIWEHISKNL